MTTLKKVFVSSTARDLDNERTAVVDALKRMGDVYPVWMKNWPAHDADAMAVCERYVRECDIFVGLIGHCFGSAPSHRTDRSYTMFEYDWAVAAGKPILIHRAPRDFSVPHDVLRAETAEQQALQDAFRDSIDRHTGQDDSWRSPASLAGAVKDAVHLKILELVTSEQEGFTLEKHELSLIDRMRDISRALPDLDGTQIIEKRRERDRIEQQLRHLEASYADKVERNEKLESLVRENQNLLSDNKIEAAVAKQRDGRLPEAYAIFTELVESASDVIERIAFAEFARGEIADEQQRIEEATLHFSRSSQLAPSFQRGNITALHHLMTGKREDALHKYRQLRDFCHLQYGEMHANTATATHNLAEILREPDEAEESERNYQRAIGILEKIGMARTSHCGDFHCNYGRFLTRHARYNEALVQFRTAVDAFEADAAESPNNYASDNSTVNSYTLVLARLGAALQVMNKIQEARSVFIQVRNRMDKMPMDDARMRRSAKLLLKFLEIYDSDHPELLTLRAAFAPDDARNQSSDTD